MAAYDKEDGLVKSQAAFEICSFPFDQGFERSSNPMIEQYPQYLVDEVRGGGLTVCAVRMIVDTADQPYCRC